MLKGTITNAPHVPRGQAFLDSRDMIRNPVEVFEKYRASLGHTFSFHFGGTRPSIVSTDPEFIQHVLQGNRDNYQKSDIQVERMVEFQGKGLVNSHGAAWLRQRRLLARGFQADRLAARLPMQQDVLDDLMARFDQDVKQGAVDIHQQMVRFTLRLVGKSLFGRSMSEEELEQIGDTITEIQGFIVRQIVQPYKIPWFRISGQSNHFQKLRLEGDELVLRHIQKRREEGAGESDFLRILLEEPYHDTGKPMSEEQVLIESLQLMVAGNETSSNGLTCVFYLLGRHPEYIPRIRDEIDRVIGDDPIGFKNLHQLELTVRVIDEALRLYPPFWMIDRIALGDDEIGGMKIPAGAMVIPYIYGTHRNLESWSDPERFDPDRFQAAQQKSRHSYSYIPFGAGPRVCIGNSMAIMQMLLIIVAFVRRYDFALERDETVNIHPMMLLRPDGPIHMRFQPRGEGVSSVPNR